MLPLAGMLFNVVSGLVVDKAQNLAKDHVGKMLDDLLPDDAKEELDKLIADDPNHPHQSAEEALQAAAEGKLPVPMKDGQLLPIEIDLKSSKVCPKSVRISCISRNLDKSPVRS